MKKEILVFGAALLAILCLRGSGLAFWGERAATLAPVRGRIELPLAAISDGKAHHFKVKAGDGTVVTFFVLQSKDGVIRAAIDACDICYRSGKGYLQEGDFMVCQNCGMRFASARINEVSDKLVIAMSDIDGNSWYCRFKKQ